MAETQEPARPNLSKTPLHPLHIEAGARMVPFAGWEMPVSYRGILEEHRTVREKAGLFDVSHMGEFVVGGGRAGEFLDHLLTNRVGGCPPGKAVYSPMCDERGGVVDDLICYRRSDGDFLVVVNAANREKDFRWMADRAGLFDVRIRDESEQWALLAVQGPGAAGFLAGKGLDAASTLGRFRLAECSWRGFPLIVSRTGYTGEDGFEIFVEAGRAVDLARALGAGGELPWIGLGARDSLRLEAGLPLYGHEMSETISPVQAGFGWAVKTAKPSFVGRDALRMEKELGPEKRVRFFVVENRRIAREGTELVGDGRVVGRVLSGSKSPLLDTPIGSALVDAAYTADTAEADSRGIRLPVRFREAPLHR
ncbi:MAG: glycine cleavage system aminomethyltransferase GcvT [Puniceicoccaceae bacterium]